MRRNTEMNLSPILEKVSNTINKRYAITFLAVYTLIKEKPQPVGTSKQCFYVGILSRSKSAKE